MRIKITILSLGALAAGFVVGAVAQASAGATDMSRVHGTSMQAHAAYEAMPAQVPTFTPTPGPGPGPTFPSPSPSPTPTVPPPAPSPSPSPAPTVTPLPGADAGR